MRLLRERPAATNRLAAVGLAGVVLVSCGSGANPTAPAAPAAAQALKTQNVGMSLTIPNRVALARNRVAQYVSSSTASVTVTVNPGNVVTVVSIGGSNCSPNPDNSAKICLFTVKAPIGTDTFSMVAYNASAVALSAASNFVATIHEGQANVTIPLVMGGIPKTMDLALPSGSTSATLAGGATSRTALTATVYDASSNIVVGPGAYVDASGALAPIVVTSSRGNGGFGYSVTPAGSTTPGATGASITLSEPGDSVALAYDGTSYVPPADILSYPAGLTTHTGGNSVIGLTFGWHFTPPFAPALLLPEFGSLPLAGHNGIVIADRVNRLGFVGDATATCTVPPVSAGTVGRIGGITFNVGVDANVYLWVNDSSETNGVGLDRIALSSVFAGGTCPIIASTAGSLAGSTTQGVAAANNKLFGIESNSEDSIESFNISGATMPRQAFGLVNNSLLSFVTHSVGVSPDGATEYVQFGEKHFATAIAYGGISGPTQPLGSFTDSYYPGGTAVDAFGNVYLHDSNASTFGANGGIDAFTPALGAANGTAQLNAPLGNSGPAGALQTLAIGPYAGLDAIYAAANDGIEIFALPSGGNIGTKIAPARTIVLPATPVSVVTNNDNREWVLLSDGTIDVLPPL